MKHIKEYKEFLNESTIEDFIKDVNNHDDIISSGAHEKDGKIVVYLDGSDPDAEEKAIKKLVRTKYKDKLKKVNDGSEDTITFKVLKESFHMPDGTPIGVDHLHRPITGTYPPTSLDESKIGDIYIMAAEAPNFPTFKKEFIKEYGEIKGSKEEKDLNTWLKSVWDERPTNEGFFTKDKGPITREDLEKSNYIQQMKSRSGGVRYANNLIDKVIKDANELNSSTNRKTMIDEIVLFISRIVSNYENMPTEKEYSNEFNHFIK